MGKKLCEIAKMIDHSLLHPTLTDDQIKDGCELAKTYDVASVCVKPYAVAFMKGILKSSSVKVGTVVGFPHGNSCIQIKANEAECACLDGAREIDCVINIGKVLSGDWDYVSKEIQTVNDVVVSRGAILKVIFENDFYQNDEPIIKLCRLCNQHQVDFVKTSTGYGFVKQQNGSYAYKGATEQHVQLMCQHTNSYVQVKAAGGIRTLDDLLRMKDLGVTRIGTSATESVMKEAKEMGYS
jgi:deoxyribose-phosphate aldolase